MLRYCEKDMENRKKNIFKSNEVMMLFVLIVVIAIFTILNKAMSQQTVDK